MKEVFLATFLAAATAADLKWQRIPNQLILLGYLGGLMVKVQADGLYGVVQGLLEGLLTIAVFYIFYMIGAVGAGDIKLLSVIGLTEGITITGQTALYSLFTAGLAAAIFTVKKRQTMLRFHLLTQHISCSIRQKKIIQYSALEQEGYLHYALYISVGFMVTLVRKEFQ